MSLYSSWGIRSKASYDGYGDRLILRYASFALNLAIEVIMRANVADSVSVVEGLQL